MTLEDFFTLTEMKDGLTAPARVEELLCVMQKEKDCVAKNVNDATRQWSTVASTLAATDNKDCLDLFIQLDGLWFINQWLKDAQNFSNDTTDNFVEESITALLRAVEKLQIDSEKSVSSGIWNTVKNLIAHNSSKIHDIARALFDGWKHGENREEGGKNAEKVGTSSEDVIPVDMHHACDGGSTKAVDDSVSNDNPDEQDKGGESAKDKVLELSIGDKSKGIADVQVQASNEISSSNKELGCLDVKDGLVESLVPLSMPNPVQGNPSKKEGSTTCPEEGTTSMENHGFPERKDINMGGKSDVTDNAKQIHQVKGSPEKLGPIESSASSTLDPRGASSNSDASNAEESVVEPLLQKKIVGKEGESHVKSASRGDIRGPVSIPKSGRDDVKVLNHCNSTPIPKSTSQGSEFLSPLLPDPSRIDCASGKPQNPETSFSRMEVIGVGNRVTERAWDRGEDLPNGSDFSKQSGVRTDAMDTRRSGMELEYGIVDALEVARQVAKEVERECSSSSEKNSEAGIKRPDSPDSVSRDQVQPADCPPNEVPMGQSSSAEESTDEEQQLSKSENLGMEVDNCMQEIESSQVTEAAQDPELNTEKSMCIIDLNQELCSDDMDQQVNSTSALISVVSASRAPAVSGSPGPLQFEGTLGWKGSAATSAFRPASPRKIPEAERILSAGVTTSGTRQRQNFLDIDLNVTEGEGEKPTVVMTEKPVITSGFPSGESSVEMCSQRSERLKLDLNRIDDDVEVLPLDQRVDGRLFLSRNGHQSPSPTSSSSLQPSLRNIDLNDKPSIMNDSSEQGPFLGKSSSHTAVTFGGPKVNEPEISIMGTRFKVSKHDFVPQNSSLPNGRLPEHAMDVNMARSGAIYGVGPTVSYPHSSVLGFSGLTSGTNMPFSSAMYGPGAVPFMVDSRVAPVLPQFLASAPAVLPPYSQPPFIMTGAPNLNGAGPSWPNLDLNSGFIIEGVNRDPGSMRQFLSPGQGRLMEESSRSSQPSSSSGSGSKRKEPDGGWEHYQFNHKHNQPPWK
ncbi:Transcription factor IIS, N-terminal [Dillenia turbinata]|uniref:Transcription factor IIS, N-terminal n=1 Tax=Dillenia turbinata TaxID=194707 RepID=A0AAN8ZIM7_9MAGN